MDRPSEEMGKLRAMDMIAIQFSAKASNSFTFCKYTFRPREKQVTQEELGHHGDDWLPS